MSQRVPLCRRGQGGLKMKFNRSLIKTHLPSNQPGEQYRLNLMDAIMKPSLQEISLQLLTLTVEFHDHMAQSHGLFPPPPPEFWCLTVSFGEKLIYDTKDF